MEVLENGDSVMADWGFNIQDDVTPLGIKVNIPPFLKGKKQLEPSELVQTSRIASLRIHVERVMDRIKKVPYIWQNFTIIIKWHKRGIFFRTCSNVFLYRTVYPYNVQYFYQMHNNNINDGLHAVHDVTFHSIPIYNICDGLYNGDIILGNMWAS